MAVNLPQPPRQRRLALIVLLAAAVVAVLAFPFRTTWWGGWILAIAEAGVVGGLADWFAVTAIFRRPLGLPIPHTALIPANWELMARRVGTMVGDRVLTKGYVTDEIGRMDLGDLLARAAERVDRDDLERATRGLARWLAAQLSSWTAGELAGRLVDLIAREPIAPLLARVIAIARQTGWDQRVLTGVVESLDAAMDKPAFREAVGDIIEDLLDRYRSRMVGYPRLLLGLASALGLIDRERAVAALHLGLKHVIADPEHPLRRRALDALAEFAERLRTDAAFAARVEAAKTDLLGTGIATRIIEDTATALHRALLTDVAAPRSEVVGWVVERLEAVRHALLTDARLRAELDRWIKARVLEVIERHHGRIAAFIENGVRALGPEGAVRLIEEHAGDDLQFIRVNGTVVGSLAGGAIYAVHLLLRLL